MKAASKARAASAWANDTIASYIRDMSMVHFYFKELGVVKYSRDELFGILDVIGKDATKSLTMNPINVWHYAELLMVLVLIL